SPTKSSSASDSGGDMTDLPTTTRLICQPPRRKSCFSMQKEPIASCIQSGPVLRKSTPVECAQQAFLRETIVWALSL
ncbi:unnamed protein product, partial [Brassica oleracea var. botrytis]